MVGIITGGAGREELSKLPIKFNKKLMWDYEISENDLVREEVFILYLSRLLNYGTHLEVSPIPLNLIEKYLPRLYLSRKVRKFWEWYLRIAK